MHFMNDTACESGRGIDLPTIRETLIYIESDCKGRPGFEQIAAAIAVAISEIDRIRSDFDLRSTPVSPARFIPISAALRAADES